MKLDYTGQTVLLTGGTGDIGQAIVKKLHQAGLKVAFTYHSQKEKADQFVQQLGENILAIQDQATTLNQTRDLVEQITDQWGPIHYLVARNH